MPVLLPRLMGPCPDRSPASSAGVTAFVSRPIRSYVRREGRMTAGQKRALARWWQSFGIDDTRQIDMETLFGRHAPCVVEIGFGMGDMLLEMAKAHPDRNFLGIEVYRPGVGSLLMNLAAQGIGNVRVLSTDAAVVFRDLLAPDSVDAVYLLFPDPWPKKRHNKRRLVQPDFVQLVVDRLRSGGAIHMATDDDDYARHMLDVLEQAPLLVNAAGNHRFGTRQPSRPQTKFETRSVRLGRQIRELIFYRCTETDPDCRDAGRSSRPSTPSRPQ